MNWQTDAILKEAKNVVSDESVFSEDQISLLHLMVDNIARAIAKESGLSNTSQGGGHGF